MAIVEQFMYCRIDVLCRYIVINNDDLFSFSLSQSQNKHVKSNVFQTFGIRMQWPCPACQYLNFFGF